MIWRQPKGLNDLLQGRLTYKLARNAPNLNLEWIVHQVQPRAYQLILLVAMSPAVLV